MTPKTIHAQTPVWCATGASSAFGDAPAEGVLDRRTKLSDDQQVHVFTIANDRIKRMDVRASA